jgi:hypothetical protein
MEPRCLFGRLPAFARRIVTVRLSPLPAARLASLALSLAACSSAPPPEPAPPLPAASAAPALASAEAAPAASGPGERSPAGTLQPFDPGIPPLRRSGLGLVVESPPRPRTMSNAFRGRADVEGQFYGINARYWVGADVPVHVPLVVEDQELLLLDRAEAPGGVRGHLAFYRQHFSIGSCGGGGVFRCRFLAIFFDEQGQTVWSLPLEPFLSIKQSVEIHDIRYEGGMLYVNEACFGDAPGKDTRESCGGMVAIEPATGRSIWRSSPRVSEKPFVVLKDHLVAGFSVPVDHSRISLVRRDTGKVVASQLIAAYHESFEAIAGDRIEIAASSRQTMTMALTGLGGPRPGLKVVTALHSRPPPPAPPAFSSGTVSIPVPFPFPLPPGLVPAGPAPTAFSF